MKKTLQVNIGGRPFIIDEDAYLTLRQYLDEVGIRLDGSESSEVMEDIETRIADLFQETLSSRIQVVNLDAVRHAIAILGSAKEFGEPIRQTTPDSVGEQQPPSPRTYIISSNGFTAAVTTGCWEAFAEALPVITTSIHCWSVSSLSSWAFSPVWRSFPISSCGSSPRWNPGKLPKAQI